MGKEEMRILRRKCIRGAWTCRLWRVRCSVCTGIHYRLDGYEVVELGLTAILILTLDLKTLGIPKGTSDKKMSPSFSLGWN